MGDSQGQGNLACCSRWCCKEVDNYTSTKKNKNVTSTKVRTVVTFDEGGEGASEEM